jgi:high-affinity nickel-transport protein
MFTLIPIICLGFFLGMRHATDADHVIAVSTIVSRERAVRSAVFIGALWGLGHTVTLMLVGGAIVLFGVMIPPRLGMGMEFSVGLMLILLGAWNLKAFGNWLAPLVKMNSAERVAGIHSHSHSHLHESTAHGRGWFDVRLGKLSIYQTVRPFVVGIVHGLAGSAALALMVLPMIHDPSWAVVYLCVFGIGTIAGMMVITAVIAWPFARTAARSEVLHHRLGLASGWISLGFGLFMIYQIGFVQGLLTK